MLCGVYCVWIAAAGVVGGACAVRCLPFACAWMCIHVCVPCAT